MNSSWHIPLNEEAAAAMTVADGGKFQSADGACIARRAGFFNSAAIETNNDGINVQTPTPRVS